MSSRQQFLKGPGDPCDNDSDPTYNNGIGEESYNNKYINLRDSPGVLERQLSQRKRLISQLEQQDVMSARERNNENVETIESKAGERGVESPSSEVQLLKRQVSIKTEKYKSSFTQKGKQIADQNEDNDLVTHQLQKSKTLKATFFLSGDKDLINKNVETNIDPKIIHNQEEEKELDRYGGGSGAAQPIDKKATNTGINLHNRQNSAVSKNQQQHQDTVSQNHRSKEESEKMSQNVIKLLQSKKTDIMKVNEEDNEILDLQLNLDEEPITQGSVDPLIEVQQTKEERFILHHAGKFRLRWDLWIITLVIYNCIQIPLELAFQEDFQNDGIDIFGYIVDINFVVDIIFNFRTTFINEKTGLEVKEGKLIAKAYVLQWRFYFDLLSVIPFELLYDAFNTSGPSNTTQFKIFDLLKLIRLLRLGRIITYLKFNQNIKIGFRIVQLLSMLLLLVHWVGCLWFLIVDGSDWIPPRDCNFGETNFYDLSMGDQYAIVFYYAILLLLGNEIVPTQTFQVVFAALIVLLGSITTAFIFGNMAALMAAINERDSQKYSQFQDQFDAITQLMRSIKLPPETQNEVEQYLLHIQHVPDMQQDMKTFLKLLSPSLRSTILFHIYKSIIRKIPIFDQCSNIELRFIVNFMKTVIFLPSDEIIKQGDKGSKIFFISRGLVEVYIGPDEIDDYFDSYGLKRSNSKGSNKSNKSAKSSKSKVSNDGKIILDTENSNVTKNKGKGLSEPNSSSKRSGNLKSGYSAPRHVRDLGEGEYFGEIALITNLKRTATVKCKDFTTLGYIMQRNFNASKEEFPQIYQAFKKQIKERYKDENFKFRQRMISNVPYFKNLSEAVIQELIYLLRPTRYDPNMLVVKRGDSTDKIYFLKAGVVDVEVPLKGDKMHFDTLNTGSCFCIFSAFHDDKKQKFDFRTRSVCIVESITARDILALQKQHLELSDELKTLMIQIENNEKSEFDFFRYVPPTKKSTDSQSEHKHNIRKKFRMALAKFFRRLKKSKPIIHMLQLNKNPNDQQSRDAIYNLIMRKTDSSDEEDNAERKQFKALHALDLLEKERKDKEQKLKYLKERCSNPSLFALSALMGKKKLFQNSNPNIQEEEDSNINQVGMEIKLENQEEHKVPHKDHNDYENTQSFLDRLSEKESVEVDINKYPRIDGIRKELDKFRKEMIPNNTIEINNQSLYNNVSLLPQPGAIIDQNYVNRVTRPEGDRTLIMPNQGDVTQTHFYTQTMQNYETAAHRDDYMQPEETERDKTTLLLQQNMDDSSALPGWKFKRNILSDPKINQVVLEKDSSTLKKIQFEDESDFIKSRDIKLQLKGEESQIFQHEDTSRINKSYKSRDGGGGGDDLIAVLNQINSNLQQQQKTMDSLQTDMLKRMGNLEKKLIRAIRLETMGPDTNKNGKQKFAIKPTRTLQPREEEKLASMQEDDDIRSPSLVGYNSPKNKRLPQHAQNFSSQYAQSEYQFIKDKSNNPESQVLNSVTNHPLPKMMSSPIKKNTAISGGASNGISKSSSPEQKKGDQESSPRNQEGPQISFHHQETLNTVYRMKGNNIAALQLNDQSMSQANANTPYFTTEYLDTLVDHQGPHKKLILNKNAEVMSDRAPTEQQEMASKGPNMTTNVQKKNPPLFSKNSSSRHHYPNKPVAHLYNQQADKSEIIEINENEMDINGILENTLVFEDQLEESIERLKNDNFQQQPKQMDKFTPEFLLFSNRHHKIPNQPNQQSQQQSQSYYFNNQNLNIIYLPNSIIQFQGQNNLAEPPRQQQQQNKTKPNHKKTSSSQSKASGKQQR